jgi:hypothetical protein
MATPASQRLRQEVDLLERFSQSYRRKFAEVIARLNAAHAPTDLQCVRLCVEAVDMMLASHSQMARSLRELTADPPPVKRAA